jgi:hypothetical protein
MARQLPNSPSVLRLFKQLQSRPNRFPLSFRITRRAYGPSHQMRGQEQSRNRHPSQSILERLHGYYDRGDSACFQQPRNVSHGHMTYWSDGHHDSGFDLLLLEHSHPFGAGMVQ